MTEFGEKLRASRKRMHMTQTELAKQVGITQRSVTDYECGKAMPRANMIRRLAQALNVNAEYLTRTDDTARASAADTPRALTDEIGAKEMADLLDRNMAFLAGGSVDQASKDNFFEALMTAYVTCKNEARAREDAAHPGLK